jgi:hypothetical protein
MKLDFFIHMAREGAQLASSILTLVFCLHRLRRPAEMRRAKRSNFPHIECKGSLFSFEGENED